MGQSQCRVRNSPVLVRMPHRQLARQGRPSMALLAQLLPYQGASPWAQLLRGSTSRQSEHPSRGGATDHRQDAASVCVGQSRVEGEALSVFQTRRGLEEPKKLPWIMHQAPRNPLPLYCTKSCPQLTLQRCRQVFLACVVCRSGLFRLVHPLGLRLGRPGPGQASATNNVASNQ